MFGAGVDENGPLVERWKWPRPDVSVYTSLILGLAASLRVSDALKMINNICRVGVSPAEEVIAVLIVFRCLTSPPAIILVIYRKLYYLLFLCSICLGHL